MRIGKRIGTAVAVTVFGFFGFVGSFAAPAEAAPEAPAAPTHGPNQNGCSFSPDSGYAPAYFNFHDACDWHDLCYTYHWYSRAGCDDRFHSLMRSWCASYHSNTAARWDCYAVAGTYYGAVRAAGWMFY